MRRFAFYVVLLIILLVQGECQVQNISELLKRFMPKEFNSTNLTLDGVKQVYREKCKKVSGSYNRTLYEQIESSAEVLMACLSGFANVSSISEEITLAKPLGELDTVFEKYCEKVPQAESCLYTFNAKILPCLTVKERHQNDVLLRLVRGLSKFACARGGGTMALFIAEDGPVCLEVNELAISQCAKSAFVEFLPSQQNQTNVDWFNLPELVLSPEHCVDMQKFEKCTLHHLEQCQEVTPANIAESVFKFIRNETACHNWLNTKVNHRSALKTANSSSEHKQVSIFLLLLCIIFNYLLRST